jgi:GNAT superfamily N-acetyltransferase
MNLNLNDAPKDMLLLRLAGIQPTCWGHSFLHLAEMEQSEVKIRTGTKQDVPQLFTLIKELALYEKAPEQVTITLEELTEDGFGPNAIYGLFVAELDAEIIGIALYYEKYSTWQGRCVYLEDIIVTESHRGKGIGHQLFQAVIGVAKGRNSARMEWQVLDWNEPAINFYKKYNANLDGEWLNGKLTREQIQAYQG